MGCDEYSIVSLGKCKECDPYRYPDKSKKLCDKISCGAFEFVNKDGICEKCPPYLFPNRLGKGCDVISCTSR